MGYPAVMTDVQAMGPGATYDIQPPVNMVWRVFDIGSTVRVGVLPNAIPNVNVSLFDGVGQGDFLQGANLRGWYRRQNIVIDNGNYCRLTNIGAGANVSFSAELVQYFGVGLSVCMSDVQNVGSLATVGIQPPINQDWSLYDIGSDQWLGAAPNGVPDVEVDLDDGTNTARIMDSTEVRQWNQEIKIPINNANFVTLTNADVALAADLCWSAELLRWSGTGMSIVRTRITAAGAGAIITFQPPAGEEWRVHVIASSVWVGISPNQLPNITVSLFDGVNASTIQTPTDLAHNEQPMDIRINNGNYLQVLDSGGAGQNIGIAAELIQMYA